MPESVLLSAMAYVGTDIDDMVIGRYKKAIASCVYILLGLFVLL